MQMGDCVGRSILRAVVVVPGLVSGGAVCWMDGVGVLAGWPLWVLVVLWGLLHAF